VLNIQFKKLMAPTTFFSRLTHRLVFLIIFYFIFGKTLPAQTFNSNFSMGNNWSQLSNLDDGLNRSGIVFRLNLSYIEKERQRSWTMGMLYRESGFAPSFSFLPDKNQSGIKLQWVELPISISFLDWESIYKSEVPLYKIHYSLGVSPARLLRINFVDYLPPSPSSEEEIKEAFRNYSLNWFIGVSFFPHPNWSVNIDFSRSALSLLKTEKAKITELGKIRQSLLTTTVGFHL